MVMEMAKLYANIDRRLYEELKKAIGMRKVPKTVWEDILIDWLINKNIENKEYESVQLVIEIDDEIYETFKRVVKYVYGNKKGSVSKAVQEALLKYLNDKVKTNENKKKAVKEYFEQKTFKG